jgi:hypothetical protein
VDVKNLKKKIRQPKASRLFQMYVISQRKLELWERNLQASLRIYKFMENL